MAQFNPNSIPGTEPNCSTVNPGQLICVVRATLAGWVEIDGIRPANIHATWGRVIGAQAPVLAVQPTLHAETVYDRFNDDTPFAERSGPYGAGFREDDILHSLTLSTAGAMLASRRQIGTSRPIGGQYSYSTGTEAAPIHHIGRVIPAGEVDAQVFDPAQPDAVLEQLVQAVTSNWDIGAWMIRRLRARNTLSPVA
ncbi:MAG TPA: hypothetical protein VLF69_02480 [Candidatus Saccharimonadales bacterium]|nr:hypothetical protein [Candidatus Saccharimonadales bacterium]